MANYLDVFFADSLAPIAQDTNTLKVRLSNELVHLLSDQLYQSPLKAIEELVVNAYDAEATECRVFVPEPNQRRDFIIVYDNGIGMDEAGLENLWQIGRSNKRTEEIELRAKRKQIGKFGIGKLATYAIANQVTYLTRKDSEILTVTLNFSNFSSDPSGGAEPVELKVKRIANWKGLKEDSKFQEICISSQVDLDALFTKATPSWTFVILEDLKPKSSEIQMGRLRWILSTAMPLESDFNLFLNGSKIASSKSLYNPVVDFQVSDLPENRIESLITFTGEVWEVRSNLLLSPSFPAGISGNVIVTRESLYGGKSGDLGRSYGFFIRVRDRLINEDDPLFGVKPLSFDTFYHFRADLTVDDLDETLTASREGVGKSDRQVQVQKLLVELFYEARTRYLDLLNEVANAEKRKRDGERNYVDPRLVEHAVADALVSQESERGGAEADESWFYLQIDHETNIEDLVHTLYTQPRTKYTYTYTQKGPTGRLVLFDPTTSTFFINADHNLVHAYGDDGLAKVLLEDFVTAEALLEVYLRTNQVPPHTVGAILEQRDALLRSLSEDHLFSLDAISNALLASISNEFDLEVALVAAARALGFVAKHISGAGEPDGIARFTDYPIGEQKITLEAKSSRSVPSLSQLDFAGLREHVNQYQAQGCLLIAPSYPGSDRANESAVANRAREERISCWTIEQLAKLVALAEARHFTARNVLDIVLNHFAPDDVAKAVHELFQEPTWEMRNLYRAVLNALKELEDRLIDSPRTVDLIAGEISRYPQFKKIKREMVEKAVADLTHASQGLLTLRGSTIVIHGSSEEIERRLEGLTGQPGEPRRKGTFRDTFSPDADLHES